MGKSIEWFGDEKGNLLPAIKILDCVFVLTESQRILHLHEEELSTKKEGSSVQYFATGQSALPERSRCQIIPPFVNTFKR